MECAQYKKHILIIILIINFIYQNHQLLVSILVDNLEEPTGKESREGEGEQRVLGGEVVGEQRVEEEPSETPLQSFFSKIQFDGGGGQLFPRVRLPFLLKKLVKRKKKQEMSKEEEKKERESGGGMKKNGGRRYRKGARRGLEKYFFFLIKINILLLFLLLEEVLRDQRMWRGRGREGHLGGDRERGRKSCVGGGDVK